MFKFFVSVIVAVHISACIWYFTARLYDFTPDTWVVRDGKANQSKAFIYLRSFYWSVTTMVTVGYGDITASTELEQAFAICWMFIGVCFYTYTIGSLSTFLTSVDTRSSILAAKVAAVQELAKETGLSRQTRKHMYAALRYNTYTVGSNWDHSLFEELPKVLKTTVVASMYGGIAKDFLFFSKRDPAFGMFVIPRLKPIYLSERMYAYEEGEHADAVYFIARGRLNFVYTLSEVVYKTFLRGSYVGEIEVIRGEPRQNNVQAYGHTDLLVLAKPDFIDMCLDFPIYAKEIKKIARERERRNHQAILEIQELIRLRSTLGSLTQLAGHKQLLLSLEMPDDDADLDPQVQRVAEQVQINRKAIVQAAHMAEETQRDLTTVLRRLGLPMLEHV